MLEIPETATIGAQAAEMLAGKTVSDVVPATSPHKFAWYNGDPGNYPELLVGRTVTGAAGHGAFVTIHFDRDTHLTVGDGTNLKFGWLEEPRPAKHQLLVEFTDGSFLVFTVAMYGVIYAWQREFDNPYFRGSLEKISPLEAGFDGACFDALRAAAKPNLSAKAFLATEQRIPGLGNGVLQDILFRAKIHPRRKIATLSGGQWTELFDTVKTTLAEMTDLGGRDTEKDFFGKHGAYRTILSKNTWKDPCPVCGGAIVKEAYLGGAVYYCPRCQSLPAGQ
jgi:formamidopyrimidine-DNA glycosylase